MNEACAFSSRLAASALITQLLDKINFPGWGWRGRSLSCFRGYEQQFPGAVEQVRGSDQLPKE